MRNRIANATNPFQGERKKVLCVCSAGLLRSPTAAWILSNAPFGFNTRACGANPEYALVPIDEALVHWADAVVVMESWQVDTVEYFIQNLVEEFPNFDKDFKIHVLDTPDNFSFRDPELIEIMLPKLKEAFSADITS